MKAMRTISSPPYGGSSLSRLLLLNHTFGINPLRESKILLESFQYDSFLSGELVPGHVLDINPCSRFHPTCHVPIMKGKAG